MRANTLSLAARRGCFWQARGVTLTTVRVAVRVAGCTQAHHKPPVFYLWFYFREMRFFVKVMCCLCYKITPDGKVSNTVLGLVAHSSPISNL